MAECRDHPKAAELLHRREASLRGKVVMVTGASSGIGRELCRDLGRAGCRIIAAARRVDRLRSLCDEINSTETPGGAKAKPVEFDVSAAGAAVEVAVGRAWEAFGRIDALVNNAGVIGKVRSPLDLSEEEWDKIVGTNLKGTWLVTKYVCRRIYSAGLKGSVINVSSVAGLDRGQLPGSIAYAASKNAVNCITKVMALELGPHNIRVNSISPGIFESEITAALMSKSWLKNVAFKTVPLRQYGTTDPALTSLVRYLIDDSSDYVSGNMFIVDAGATLPGIPIFSSL